MDGVFSRLFVGFFFWIQVLYLKLVTVSLHLVCLIWLVEVYFGSRFCHSGTSFYKPVPMPSSKSLINMLIASHILWNWVGINYQLLMYVLCLVAQSCLTLCDPLDYSLPGSSVHGGILQARIWEWVAIPSSWRSYQPRDWTQVSCNAGGFFTIWATREAQESWSG